MNWQTLTSVDQLDSIIAESHSRPVLIFKHSTRCSISAATLDRLERKWNLHDAAAIPTYYLDLIRHREVSNEVASRFSVPHQSPQAILLHEGKVVYDDSHFGVNYDEIESQVETLRHSH